MEDEYITEAKEILQPILDVFTAVDGAGAFVKLYHGHFPDFVKIANENPNDVNAQGMVDAFKLVSKMCKYVLDN